MEYSGDWKMGTCDMNSTSGKVALFRGLFSGLQHVYGTYDPVTKRVRVVKEPVTNDVILAHLKGKQPYGVFLLVDNRTCAIAADFDDGNTEPVTAFVKRAAHYGLDAYVERSKSKGYHAWIFFEEGGVSAAKARLVVQSILEEIDLADTEVFPKQDSLNTKVNYGNFINAPLFGALVPKGRTVFVDPARSFRPFPDQWNVFRSVRRVAESLLDEIIEINELRSKPPDEDSPAPSPQVRSVSGFGLPPCARRILNEGVTENQRVVCFRLAVHMRRLGLPFDVALGALNTWAGKNRPANGKRVITKGEIISQTRGAYRNGYRGYGCDDPAIAAYCDDQCPVKQPRHRQSKDR